MRFVRTTMSRLCVLSVLVCTAIAGGAPDASAASAPDLVVASGAARAGYGSIVGNVTTRNVGTRAATRSAVRVSWRAGSRGTLTSLVVLPPTTLGIGRTSTRTFRVTPPAAARSGVYSLIACADARREVREGRERNNCDVLGWVRWTNRAPVTTIAPGQSALTNDSTPTFSLASNEPRSRFSCRVDDGSFEACTTPVTTGVLDDGPHVLSVRAIDVANVIDASPARTAFTVDTTGPQLAITSPSTGPTNTRSGASMSLGGTAADRSGVSSVTWSNAANGTSGVAMGSGNWSVETLALALGGNAVTVTATDSLGNSSTDELQVTRDETPPATTIEMTPSGLTNDASPVFRFVSDEAAATFECRIDLSSFTPCTSPFTSARLDDGPHSFDVRAVDAAGTPDPTPATSTFSIDATAPETTLTLIPPAIAQDTTPTLEFTSNEAGTFECRIDAAAYTACASPYTVPVLADGIHAVDVRAIDQATNRDASPARATFTIDNAAPETTITVDPGLTNDNTPNFEFASSEPGSSFECSVDAGQFVACSSPYAIDPPLGDGLHAFEVRATDQVGNLDATAASSGFQVDTTPPETLLYEMEQPVTADITADFAFFGFNAGANPSYECSIDDAPFSACFVQNEWYETPVLAEGPHTFAVRAIDTAGNVDPTPERHAFRIDLTAPVVEIDTPTQEPWFTTGDLTIDMFGFATDASDIYQVELHNLTTGQRQTSVGAPSWAFGGILLNAGENVIVVTAIDVVGNSGTDTITIVRAPPG